MQFMGTHFPFHQKPTLTIMTLTQMTLFIKKKVHSFIAMHPHKYIYFYFATIVILLPLRRAALQVSCNEVG